MPRAIDAPTRRAIRRRYARGQGAADIARALGLAPRTVRHLLLRFRAGGDDALRPGYRTAGQRRTADQETLFAQAVPLRRDHATWGAGRIRVALAGQTPPPPLPTVRTLQRWFAGAGLGPAPQGRRPEPNEGRAPLPHAVWQRDAAEQIPWGDGSRCSWLRLCDECTGAVLWTAVFPPGVRGRGRSGRRA